MRFLGAVLVFLCCPAWAAQQPATAAPPPAATQPAATQPAAEVDRALRERVTRFFQAHVDGRFRLADQYVAEDTKDLYFAMEKPRYQKFELGRITYSEDHTRATVVVNCERVVSTPFGPMNFNMPQQTTWKLENGQWFWYLDPNLVRTPFMGIRPAETPLKPPPGPAVPIRRPKAEEVLQRISSAVLCDKSEVRLTAQAPTAEVVLTNTMPGAVSLKIEAHQTPWLEAALDRQELAPKDAARLSLRYRPQAAVPAPVALVVRVEPSGQVIPIQVLFGPAH
jgi:hypothetical protein